MSVWELEWNGLFPIPILSTYVRMAIANSLLVLLLVLPCCPKMNKALTRRGHAIFCQKNSSFPNKFSKMKLLKNNIKKVGIRRRGEAKKKSGNRKLSREF